MTQHNGYNHQNKSSLNSALDNVRHQAQSGLQSTINFLGHNDEVTTWQQGGATEVQRWASLVVGGVIAIYGLRRSLFGLTLTTIGGSLVYRGLTGRWPLPETIRGNSALKKAAMSAGRPDPVTKSTIVKSPVSDVYDLWSNFENFPKFMDNIESITLTGDNDRTGEPMSHWVMRGPLETLIEWDARTTRMEENKRIAWSSTQGDIETSGQVLFTSLPDGETEVAVTLLYVPPAGLLGQAVVALFGDPEGKLARDLTNFKRQIETEAGHRGEPSAVEQPVS